MNFSSNITFSNGTMVIKNGSQTIKMGPGGMEITNGSNNNVVMSSNGIHVYNGGTNRYSVDISSTNGIKINGRPAGTTYYNTTNGTTYGGPSMDYSDDDEDEDDGDNEYDEDDGNEDSNYFYSMPQNQNMGNANPYNAFFYNQNNNNYMGNYFNEEEDENEIEEEEDINVGLDAETISSLPVMTYSSKMEMQAKMTNKKSSGPTSNNFCSICIVDYKNGDKLRSLPCFHRFHKKCIDEWLFIKNQCPLCKSAVPFNRNY